MGPIDYTAGQLGPQDFLRNLQGGFQLGAGIQEAQQIEAARDMAMQQKQLAMQRQQQYQSDVSAALAAPREQQAQLFSALALRNPDQYEAITKGWGALSADQQKNELRDTFAIASTLHSDRPDLALQQIDERITAMRNSGQPTQDLEALRGMVERDPQAAYSQVLHIASVLPGGDAILKNLQSINKDAREGAESDATVAGKVADNVQKNLALVGQRATALAKPGVKASQAETFFRTMGAQGLIPKDQVQGYVDGIPSNPADVQGYLAQIGAAGMKADDQMKFTTPTADAKLQSDTSIRTTGMNNATSLEVQSRIDARAKAESENGDDAASFSQSAIDNAAARYNIDGTLPPMGMGKAAAAGRTKILNRAAELKAGIDPEQQRRDQLNNKADIANKNRAIAAFNQGKQGNAIRSFNVLLTHLDTLDSLSDALDNGNIQAVNRLGNAFAKATGKAAPTNFEGVKHIVGDELVKAVTGGAGALGDREAIAATINSANSPAQLRGMIHNYKELAVGQLTGLEGQYKVSTGLNDFEHLLSPAARLMRNQHGGGAGAAGSPAGAGKVVDFGSLK